MREMRQGELPGTSVWHNPPIDGVFAKLNDCDAPHPSAYDGAAIVSRKELLSYDR